MRGIFPRRDTLFCSDARKIKKLEAGIHLAYATTKPEAKCVFVSEVRKSELSLSEQKLYSGLQGKKYLYAKPLSN
jgi:hypothetical protein